MELKIASTSIVIVAQAHNPTILHPAFLVTEEIVPRDWKLAAEPPISTPAISVVRFANQISFIVDPNKFQVVDTSAGNKPSIADLAGRYVRKLPHVHYSAVGININGYAECNTPENWILERFVKQGAWNQRDRSVKAAGIKLVYDIVSGQLNITLDVGIVQIPETPEKPCITINGNYHMPIKPENAVEKTAEAILTYAERIDHFRDLTNAILNG